MSIFDSQKEREKQYFLQSQASGILNVSPELRGHLERYEDPMKHRLDLLKLQRLKFKPSDAVVKKAKKKARKLKRTKNLKGEYARIKREQKRYERGERRDAPGKEPYILGEDYATRMAQAVAAGVAAGGGGGGGFIGPAPAVVPLVAPAVAPAVVPVVPPVIPPVVAVPPFHGLIPPVGMGPGGGGVGVVGAGVPAAHLAEIGALRAQMDQARQEILRLGREDRGVPPLELRAEMGRLNARYGALGARLDEAQEVHRAMVEDVRGEGLARVARLDEALAARLGEAEAGIRRMGDVEGRHMAALEEIRAEGVVARELTAAGRQADEARIAEVDRALTARLGEAEVSLRGIGQVEARNQVAMDALEQRQTQELEAMGRLLAGHEQEFVGIQEREEVQRELQAAGLQVLERQSAAERATAEQRSALQGAELGELQRERAALQRRMDELQSTHGDEVEELRRQHAQQAREHTALDTRLSGQQDALSRDVMEGQRQANEEVTRRMGTIETGSTGIREELRQQQARASALDDRFVAMDRNFAQQRQRAEEADTERRLEEQADFREQISALARRAAEERGAHSDTQRQLLDEQVAHLEGQLAEIQASGERRVGDLESELAGFRREFRNRARDPLPEGQYPDSSDEEEADEALDGAMRQRVDEREGLRVPAVAEPEPARPLQESGELVAHPADVEREVEEDIAQGRLAQEVAEGQEQEPGVLQQVGEGARDVAMGAGGAMLRGVGGVAGGMAERAWEAVPAAEEVGHAAGRAVMGAGGMMLQGGAALGGAALEGAGIIGGGEEPVEPAEPAEVHRQLPAVPEDVGADEDGGGGAGIDRRHSQEGLEMVPAGGGMARDEAPRHRRPGMARDEARLSERRDSVRLWESPEFQTGLGEMAERGRPMGGRERTHRIRNVSDESIWGIEPGEYREIMGAEHESGGTRGKTEGRS